MSKYAPETPPDRTVQLLEDVNHWEARRVDVAQDYAAAIRYGWDIDWPRVDTAIIERWSPRALVWIKCEAWKLVSR